MTVREIPAQLAAACPAVRLPGPHDQLTPGLRPSFVAAPASTAEASAVLRAAAELGLAVVPRGTGSKLDWGGVPERSDLIIETARLDRVVEHAAGDLVATVQAGMRLADLAAVLGAASQRLALDPAGGGTVGGVLATGVAGPLRLRYGTPRDLLIGITFVRADGTIARSGGKVVKNVAGYDLGKLLAGSYGTLGLITEATFRLHPVPAAVSFVTASYSRPGDAATALSAAVAAPLAVIAAELDWPSQAAPVSIAVAVEGDPASVAERASGLAALMRASTPAGQPVTRSGPPGIAAPGYGPASSGPPGIAPSGSGSGTAPRISTEPPPWWGASPPGARDGTLIQLAFWAGYLAEMLAAIGAATPDGGPGLSVRGSAAAGVLQVAVPASADPAATARFLARLRAAAGGLRPAPAWIFPPADTARPGAASGPGRSSRPSAAGGLGSEGPGALGNVVVLRAPPAVRELADPFGPAGALPLMTAVKRQFDPERRLAPGRLPGIG